MSPPLHPAPAPRATCAPPAASGRPRSCARSGSVSRARRSMRPARSAPALRAGRSRGLPAAPGIAAAARLGDNARPMPPQPATARSDEKPMPTRRELANVIRVLAMDAVQQANSGHPGAPMGMADIAEVLWREVHHQKPANPRLGDPAPLVLFHRHAPLLPYSPPASTGV